MIFAGIDVGSKNVHITIIKDGKIIIKEKTPAGIYKKESAEELFNSMLGKAGIQRKDLKRIIATGNRGENVSFAHGYIPDIAADAYCIHRLFPSVRTIIDIGAEGIRIIKIDEKGLILDFAVNEKCAAGTGIFVEAMARALEITLSEMSQISLRSTSDIHINAQCAVFGESEVVSLIHQKIPKADIARAVHNAIARRVASIARSVGLENEILMVGGGAKNRGLLDSLKREINMEIKVPNDPGFIGSTGAAYAAEDGVPAKEIKAVTFKTLSNLKSKETEPVFANGETKTEHNKAKDFWRWPESKWLNPDIDWEKGKYITAGVDVGSVSTQAAIMVDGELFAFSNTRTGSSSPDSAEKAISLALADSDLTMEQIHYCVATGYGRVNVPIAQQAISEIACIARGANFFYGPAVRTIIDIGGQDCKVIRVDERGKVAKFIMNDKCAAGTGRGMEIFADLLRVPIWEIGPRSFQIKKRPEPIDSTCVLFAKSEVLALLEAGVPENEVIAAYCMAVAHRIVSLVNRLGLEKEVCISGGIAKNEGIWKRIEEELGIQLLEQEWYNPQYRKNGYPFDPQIIGVSGAALLAFEILKQEAAQRSSASKS